MSTWIRRNGIIILMIPILAMSLFRTYLLLSPEFQPKTAPNPAQDLSIAITPEYRVTAKADTMLWPAGASVPKGLAAYFYAAQPEVNLNAMVEITGLTEGKVDGTVRSNVMIQAVNEKSVRFWSYPLQELPEQSFALGTGVGSNPEPPRFTTAEITLNVQAVYAMVDQITKEIGFQSGILQMVVTTNVKLLGTANGEKIEKNMALQFPLDLRDTYFTIPNPADRTIKVTVAQKSSTPARKPILKILQENWMPLAADALLMILFVALIVMRARKRSKTALEHKRFKSWITEGNYDTRDKVVIQIFSLEGVVDLAIDLEKRVICDSKVGKYFVFDDDVVYVYSIEQADSTPNKRQKLGKLLLDQGILSLEQLETGLYYQQRTGSKLGETLVALGFVDETTLYSTLAAQQNINYLELNPKKELADDSWLAKMSLNKARALQALPLGTRADGKLVIACSEPAKEGVRKALEESFGTDIITVAARPSAIHEGIERLGKEQEKPISTEGPTITRIRTQVSLTAEEWETFTATYYRGNVNPYLLLKALGRIDPAIFPQLPKNEPVLPWLVHRNLIEADLSKLVMGLDKYTLDLSLQLRQEKKIPDLMELLNRSDYLTAETMDWIKAEMVAQDLALGELLIRNHLASEETVQHAARLLKTLENLLHKSEVEPR